MKRADTTSRAPSLIWRTAALAVTLAVLGASAAAPGRKSAREDRERLKTTLWRILVGQSVEAKIALGHPHTYHEKVVNSQITRPVHTDVQPSGSISYVMPWNAIPVLFKRELSLRDMSSTAQPGAELRVREVEVDRDRFEIELVGARSGQVARLRLWYSSGFASGVAPREVVDRLGNYLSFGGTLGEYVSAAGPPDFAEALQQAESAAQRPNLAPADRLALASRALELVVTELSRRRAWSELSGEPAEVADLERRQAALQGEVGRLAEEIHGPRLAALRTGMDELVAQIGDLRESARGSGWSEESLATCSAVAENLRMLLAQYEELRGGDAAARRSALEEELTALADARRGLLLEREERLAAETKSLADTLGSKAPTSIREFEQQQAQVARYRETVESRRALVADLGEGAPPTVVQRLEVDAGRAPEFDARLSGAEEGLRPQILDSEYRKLERERSRLFDRYTLEFGGSGHAAAAGALFEHIGQMIRNRREAANLGNGSARSQLQELDRARREIRRRAP